MQSSIRPVAAPHPAAEVDCRDVRGDAGNRRPDGADARPAAWNRAGAGGFGDLCRSTPGAEKAHKIRRRSSVRFQPDCDDFASGDRHRARLTSRA